MTISHCPHCHERFRLPTRELPEDAYAECPWCGETLSAAEIIDRLPPMLTVFSANGEVLSATTSAMSRANVEFESDPKATGLGTRSTDHGDDPDEPPRRVLKGVQDSKIYGDSRLVIDEYPRSSGRSRSRSRSRSGRRNHGLRSLVGVVVGGLAAVPLAGLILWALGRTPDIDIWPFNRLESQQGGSFESFAGAESADNSTDESDKLLDVVPKFHPRPAGPLSTQDSADAESPTSTSGSGSVESESGTESALEFSAPADDPSSPKPSSDEAPGGLPLPGQSEARLPNSEDTNESTVNSMDPQWQNSDPLLDHVVIDIDGVDQQITVTPDMLALAPTEQSADDQPADDQSADDQRDGSVAAEGLSESPPNMTPDPGELANRIARLDSSPADLITMPEDAPLDLPDKAARDLETPDQPLDPPVTLELPVHDPLASEGDHDSSADALDLRASRPDPVEADESPLPAEVNHAVDGDSRDWVVADLAPPKNSLRSPEDGPEDLPIARVDPTPASALVPGSQPERSLLPVDGGQLPADGGDSESASLGDRLVDDVAAAGTDARQPVRSRSVELLPPSLEAASADATGSDAEPLTPVDPPLASAGERLPPSAEPRDSTMDDPARSDEALSIDATNQVATQDAAAVGLAGDDVEVSPEPTLEPEPTIELEPTLEPEPTLESEAPVNVEAVSKPEPRVEPAAGLESPTKGEPATNVEPANDLDPTNDLEPEPSEDTEPVVAAVEAALERLTSVAAMDPDDRGNRLLLTYRDMALACDLSSESGDALQRLATAIQNTPLRGDLGRLAYEWLIYKKRPNSGIVIIGDLDLSGAQPKIAVDPAKVIRLTGEVDIETSRPVLILGRIGDPDSVEPMLIEPLLTENLN